MTNAVAVILAGGSGSRLWPLSRQQLPKQFLNLEGDDTLIGSTMTRLSPLIEPENIWVVTNEAHAGGEAYEILNGLNTILEPVGRNTAPAIAIAAALLSDLMESDPLMVVLPADHLIKKREEFHRCLQCAMDVAGQGRLVTFGITPTRPDTGFGYIQADLAQMKNGVSPVVRFAEKPDLATAGAFVASGDYFWNSGMFVWKASVLLAEVARYLPEVAEVVARMRGLWQGGEPWGEVVRREFAAMPSVSIDYGVMERSEIVSVVEADIGWSDVGSWDAVYDISGHDESGNALVGNVLNLDCNNALIRSESKLVAAIGLEDVIVVETPDAILLTKRGESQRVKDVVELLKTRGGSSHLEHLTVRRPWGSYTVLEDHASGYKLKRIEVRPGASLSLQSHQHRSEHWVVVSGTATVTCGDKTFAVAKNESTYIPIGEMHRLANRGRIPLQMIEVQVGEYLGEDDIERFEDSYGRTGP